MASARLFLNEKTVRKDGKTAVYALIHIDSKSLKINTGVAVALNKWDKDKERVRGNDKDAKDANLVIDKCLSAINEIFVRYRLQQKKLTADLLLQEYNNPTNYLDFHSWIDKRIDRRVREKEIGAVSGKHHKVLVNKLKEYRPELSFAEIDLKFIQNFRAWLRTSKGNSINTVQKTLAYLRCYLNIAVREEIISVNPLELVELKRTKVQIVYLNETELTSLEDFYKKGLFQENYHLTVRHFLFMCYTGIRISDFKRLKTENIQNNVLRIIPHKTREQKPVEIYVPLIDKALKLINDENSQTEFLFNPYADQKMNEYLKKIADLAGIHKKIKNHAARHTFATLFLRKTKNVAVLQKLLGHSNISETMRYVHISTKEIDDEMKIFERNLIL